MEEKILLDIVFNNDEVQAAIKNIAAGRKAIDDLVEANKELAKQGQKNSTEYVKNQESIKALSAEVNQNSKIVQANTQANKANAESLDALKARNKQILIDRDKLTTATEEGRAAIQKLNDEYDKNAAVIAKNSTEVEKQRFNIGNYISGLSGVSPILGQINQTASGMASGLKSVSSGFGAASAAGKAFTLIPIIAVITAIVAGFKLLQTFLTGSTAGMDLLEDVMSSVSVVMDVVTDRVTKFVGAIGKLLSGDISGGFADMKSSLSGIGDEIEREIALTLELNKAIRELEDAEINYDIQASKTANTIKTLLLQSKNRTLSEKERIKLLDQASKLEEDQNKQLIKNREEALRIANDEANKRVEIARIAGETEDAFAQRLLDTGLLLDDQRDKVKDSIIAFNNALGEGISVQEKIQNQRDALEEKAEAEREKRAEAEKKRLDDIAKKQEEIRQRNASAENELEILRLQREAREIQGIENQTDKLIEIEQLKAEQLLANTKLTEAERQLIIFQSEEAINQILRDGADKKLSEDQKMLAQSLEDYKNYVQELINEEKEKYLSGEISKEEYDQSIADMDLAALEVQKAIKEQFGQEDLALNQRITDAKIAQKKYETDESLRLERAKVDGVKNTIGSVAGLFNKQSAAFKALASAQTLIQTYQSATAAFAGMTSSIPGPVGIALGIAAAAAAIISGLANVAKINSVAVPKMAEGGMIEVGGRRHSQGGEDVAIGGKVVANVERGEKMAILKRGADTSLLKNLSTINALAGGRDFYKDRAPRYRNQDGGLLARAATTQRKFNSEVQQASELKVALQVTELHRVEDNIARAEINSELR